MRWQAQQLSAVDDGALPGLSRISGLVRTVRTPEFAGVTFYEVQAKSALNRVPGGSPMPFEWTVNPMRGCVHSCTYCFARKTHEYLDLDTGRDFDNRIVVKVNVGDVVRREVARASWAGAHVALGTNTDPYQRPEGRYRLMPGIIDALVGSGTPLSILTKGTLLRRDLPQLTAAAERVPVGVGVSLALLDPVLQARFEPGTPTPRARLELVRAVREAGLRCSVMVAPVLPYLTDTTDQLDAIFAELAAVGATHVTVLALHLRPGTREWFMSNLARDRPDLVPRYRALYGRGSYVAKDYRETLQARVRPLLDRYRFGRGVDVEDSGGDPGQWVHELRMPGGPSVAELTPEPALF
ncbi:MAG: Rv2578c family radical SAM protein [Nakamurella sp.]